jgi:hypothetical protein
MGWIPSVDARFRGTYLETCLDLDFTLVVRSQEISDETTLPFFRLHISNHFRLFESDGFDRFRYNGN